MVFNKTITLLKGSKPNGTEQIQFSAGTPVRADVSVPSMNTAMNAEMAGFQVDYTVQFLRSIYEKDTFTHVQIGSDIYQIVRKTAAEKRRYVKLILSRG